MGRAADHAERVDQEQLERVHDVGRQILVAPARELLAQPQGVVVVEPRGYRV